MRIKFGLAYGSVGDIEIVATLHCFDINIELADQLDALSPGMKLSNWVSDGAMSWFADNGLRAAPMSTLFKATCMVCGTDTFRAYLDLKQLADILHDYEDCDSGSGWFAVWTYC